VTLRSNDMLKILKPDPAASGRNVAWRKGVIVTWNRDTAENTVLINGVLVENVPILNTSEAAILAAGDVVGLISFGSTWGILGRFTIPGSPEAVTALSSLRIASDTITGIDTITSTTYTDATTNPGPVMNIVVGPSGRLLVLVSANLESNATGTAGNTYKVDAAMSFKMTGANTAAASTLRALTLLGDVTITSSASTFLLAGALTKAVLVSGLNPGLTTLTAQYRKGTAATPTSARFFDRNLTAMATL
jgi:hypothetical protein